MPNTLKKIIVKYQSSSLSCPLHHKIYTAAGRQPSSSCLNVKGVSLEFDGLSEYAVDAFKARLLAAVPGLEVLVEDSLRTSVVAASTTNNYVYKAKPKLLITITGGERFLVETTYEDITKEICWVRDHGFTPYGRGYVNHHNPEEIQQIDIKPPETTMQDIEKEERGEIVKAEVVAEDASDLIEEPVETTNSAANAIIAARGDLAHPKILQLPLV